MPQDITMRIQCDTGGCSRSHTFQGNSPSMAKRFAEKAGWVVGTICRCPQCNQRIRKITARAFTRRSGAEDV